MPKVTWKQAAPPPLGADPPIATVAHDRSTVFASWRMPPDGRQPSDQANRLGCESADN